MPYVYYNISNISGTGNETTILTFVSGVNDVMGGFPALMILIAIGVVLLLSLIGRGTDVFKSFSATSFVMFILALIMYPMNLISGKSLITFAVLVPISVFLLWVWGTREFG